MSEQVEGVPKGWRLVRIGRPKVGEYAISFPDTVVMVNDPMEWDLACIVERIEPLKTYRPFANAAEFEPHRDRWWMFKVDQRNQRRSPQSYDDCKYWNWCWKKMFEDAVFDDGSPFGIECEE